MTLKIDLYEMNYACSPGGVDCWEATVHMYGNSSTATDFKTAGEAVDWLLDRYPTQVLELHITSLPVYERQMA